MRKLKPIIFVGVAVFLAVFLLRSGKAETFEVVLTENGFEPSAVVVPKGSNIIFSTKAGKPFWPASDPHPLHDNYPGFDPQKPIGSDESWTFKARKVGEWGFHDHLFFTRRGKLTVVSKKQWSQRQKVLTRQELSKLIDKVGAEGAYAEVKKLSDLVNPASHSSSHLFGEVLYEKEGISGISVCDDYAGFGCYHGLFVKAVSDRGLAVAKELDRACVEKFGILGLGCPHGIGHGLVEFLGYDKLNEALDICAQLTWQGELFGCQSGVLMEYNFRTIFEEGGSEVVTREAHGNLYEPCQSVAERFGQACFFEQAAWWREVLNSDDEKVGAFCGGINNSTQKEACFLGLGDAVAERSFYDKEAVKEACSRMPDDYGKALCFTGGAWAYFANPEKENESPSLCEDLGRYKKLCLEKRILVK